MWRVKSGLFWLVPALLVLGCVSAPRMQRGTQRATSTWNGQGTDSPEDQRHPDDFAERHGGSVRSPAVLILDRIVERLSNDEFAGGAISIGVLGSRSPNAFALPTGQVYVTAGLLDIACTEEDLAAVVAHELAHLEDWVTADVASLTTDDKLWVEASADARAVTILLNAGYEPYALSEMIARLAKEQPTGWARFRCDQLAHILGVTEDDVHVTPALDR
jgi:Peptidase family M48